MIDDEGADPVRAELDHLAAATPPVSFTAGDLIGRGRRRRQLRRGAAIGGTAAALALVVAVPTAALRGAGTDGTGVAAGTSGPAATPTASPTSAPDGIRVPGLSPADAERIARACAASFGGFEEAGVTPTPGVPGTSPGDPQPSATPGDPLPSATPGDPQPTTTPGDPEPSASSEPEPTPSPTGAVDPQPSATPRGWAGAPRVQIYNRVVDAAGEHVLAYGPSTQIGCDREGTRWNAGGMSGLDTAWLPGPVAVDGMSAAPGGVRHSGANAPSGPGYILVEGRVSRQVARLTVAVGVDRAVVRPLNGTFLVRFVKSTTWRGDDAGELRITATDGDGRALPGVSINSKRSCWVDPAGRVVVGNRDNSPAPCLPATRWR